MSKQQHQQHTMPQHRYLRKLRYLMKIGAIPTTVGMHQISVYHDNDCPIWEQRWCTCDADIRLAWSQPDTARN